MPESPTSPWSVIATRPLVVTMQHIDVDERDRLDCAGRVGEEPELGRVIPGKEHEGVLGLVRHCDPTPRIVVDAQHE
jgi:hypothetical protein